VPRAALSEPTDAEVRSFGHLAQDIAYLRRGCGLVVAPFKEGFRIGTDVVDADGMRARADRERKRRNHTVAATAVPAPSIPVVPPKPVIPPACGCGRLATHQGRCWVRRGWKGPTQPELTERSVAKRLEAIETDVAELKRLLGGDGR
jgi:hypothetical protein